MTDDEIKADLQKWTELATKVAARVGNDTSILGGAAGVSNADLAKLLKFAAMVGTSSFNPGTTIEGVDAAISLLKKANTEFGLGNNLLEMVGKLKQRQSRACLDPPDKAKPLANDNLAKRLNEGLENEGHVLYYWVDGSLKTRKIGNYTGQELVRTGWCLWQRVAEIITRDLSAEADGDPKNANVLIREEKIDGASNTLGLAHVGGKNITQQLVLRMDIDEDWTELKFIGAICHEMGHILGLKHSSKLLQLMSPTLDLEGKIYEPQDEDKDRLLREAGWLPAKPVVKPIASPTPDFPGAERLAAFRAKQTTPNV